MEERNEPTTMTDASSVRKEKGRAIITLGFLLHASLFAYWVFVHMHESYLLARAKSIVGDEHHIPGAFEFPARWKYMTIVNLVGS